MAIVPDQYLDLIESKVAFANLATLMSDGSPQVTPVWFDTKGDLVRINTAIGRVKARNMKPGSAIALSIMDPDNPYRYVQIRGRVTRTTQDGADEHIDALSHKYMGKPYPFRRPGEERIIYEIAPTFVSPSG